MNIDLLILWLNFLAAIFMGVEYLFNAPLQKKIDSWLADKLERREKFTANALEKEIPYLKEKSVYRKFFVIFLTMITTAGVILAGGSNVWPFYYLVGGFFGLLLGITFAVTFLVSVNLITNLVPALPFIIFSSWSVLVRKCPKGVVAGFGFTLLMTSFILQFYKAYG